MRIILAAWAGIFLLSIARLTGQEVLPLEQGTANGWENPSKLVNQLIEGPKRNQWGTDPAEDLRLEMRRWSAVSDLAQMGTNAWTAIPSLVAVLNHRDFGAVAAAAVVLGGIQAGSSPQWPLLRENLKGKTNASHAFHYLTFGKDQFMRPFGLKEKRFGLLGLKEVGAVGRPAEGDILDLFSSPENYLLWPAAVEALMGIGVPPGDFVPRVINWSTNGEAYPTVRVSAIEALIPIKSRIVTTTLESLLQDQSSQVRLAVIEVLSEQGYENATLVPLLQRSLEHKLPTVRIKALRVAAKMKRDAAILGDRVMQMMKEDASEEVRDAAKEALVAMQVHDP